MQEDYATFDPAAHRGPYASVQDLPSMRELSDQLQSVRPFTGLLSREYRVEIEGLEAQLNETVDIVDGFYTLLGPHNWIFHESMNLDSIRRVLDGSPDPEEAERRLINYYHEPDTLRFMSMLLIGLAPMHSRLELIDKAKIDYQEGRYYAVVLLLISIMDGLVNDVETNQRRGLYTCSSDEINVWDGVTAHHLGLARAHREFTRTFKKPVFKESFELNRHGIMHGNVVNYDNIVVATKAWNMLFAVADWATVILRPSRSAKLEPTWAELREKMADTRRRRETLNKWQPSCYEADEVEPEFGSPHAACLEFLENWKRQRFDAMGKKFISFGPPKGAVSGEAQSLYAEFLLDAFEVRRIRNEGACLTITACSLSIGDTHYEVELRWLHHNQESGQFAFLGEPGEWVLSPYDPSEFLGDPQISG